MTVEDEILGDVRAAATWLRSTTNARFIFVLGHSLGGMLAPRLIATTPGFRGAVLVAANARPLHVLLAEQIDTLPASGNSVAADLVKAAHELGKRVDTCESGSEVWFGAPLSYWSDLAAYDPVATAQSIDVPMLLVFGGADDHVTSADVELWRKGLGDHARASIHLLPGLNHLMMEGDDHHYYAPNHVSPSVVALVNRWLAENSVN